jgi:aminoglycoside phosphotransferase
MAPYDLSFRPGDLIPNIIHGAFGEELSAEDKKKLKTFDSGFRPTEIRDLCRACGWNTKHELASSYLPRVRVEHTRANSGLWVMGNDWMLWDRTEEGTGNDYMTHEFLRKQNTKNILIVKTMMEFADEDGGYKFLVMSRARGIPLGIVWPTLAPNEKEGYVQQMAAALRELRQFTAEFPQRVDGGPLWDNVIANCNSRKRCIKIGKTTDEWFNNMDEELREGIARRLGTRDKAVVEAHLQVLKVHFPPFNSKYDQALTPTQQNFPAGPPYVLTHADLNLGNILVHEGKIIAIIDWELAGYYPWWVEILTSHDRSIGDSGHELFDAVWKELGTSLDDIWDKIHPVSDAWRYCPVQHTGKTHYWLRPAFCKCQPFGGEIDKR